MQPYRPVRRRKKGLRTGVKNTIYSVGNGQRGVFRKGKFTKMTKYTILIGSFAAVAVISTLAIAQEGSVLKNEMKNAKLPLYNTAKQKLLDGKQIFSFTQSTFSP